MSRKSSQASRTELYKKNACLENELPLQGEQHTPRKSTMLQKLKGVLVESREGGFLRTASSKRFGSPKQTDQAGKEQMINPKSLTRGSPVFGSLNKTGQTPSPRSGREGHDISHARRQRSKR